MREPGEIRRREDGTFEYLKSTSFSLRGGYVEQWESACEHAARHMRLPEEFERRLRAAGYNAGGSLFDLLIAEGWKRPQRNYIELGSGEESEAYRVSQRAAEFIEPPKPTLDSGE